MLEKLIEEWAPGKPVVRFNYIEIVDKRHVTVAGLLRNKHYCKVYDFSTAEETREFFNQFVKGAEDCGYTTKVVDSNTVTFTWPD